MRPDDPRLFSMRRVVTKARTPAGALIVELRDGITPAELSTALRFTGLDVSVDLASDAIAITRRPTPTEVA
jgi:hypothetical protein